MLNAVEVLYYHADSADDLLSDDRMHELTFENVRFTGLKHSFRVDASAKEPLTVRLRNVTVEFNNGPGSLFDPERPNIMIMTS